MCHEGSETREPFSRRWIHVGIARFVWGCDAVAGRDGTVAVVVALARCAGREPGIATLVVLTAWYALDGFEC